MHWLTHRPLIRVLMGVILFATGLFETWEALEAGLEIPTVGAHHGAMMFGGFYAFKNVPHIFEGIEYLAREEL